MAQPQDPALERDERYWQDLRGGDLQQRAFDRRGTRLVLEKQFERVAEALRVSPGMTILDIGCGVGHFLAWLASRQAVRCHGVDVSYNSLVRARDADRGLHLTAGDAGRLPFLDESFDRISCNGAAHHFLHERSAFSEMNRVLKPGGVLVMHEPSASALTSAFRRVFLRSGKYESPADLAHKEEFTPARAGQELRDARFTEITITLHDFLAYPLSGNYIASPFAGSERLMRLFWRVEQALARKQVLRRAFDLLSWRILVVATKASPPAGSALSSAGRDAS